MIITSESYLKVESKDPFYICVPNGYDFMYSYFNVDDLTILYDRKNGAGFHQWIVGYMKNEPPPT